jgi:hypothetical protein
MDISRISILGGLAITALVIIANAVVTIWNKKIELKQTRYKIIMDCAFKEWERTSEVAVDLAAKTGKTANLYPFAQYIVYYKEFIKLMDKRNITEKHLKKFNNKIYKKINLFKSETQRREITM